MKFFYFYLMLFALIGCKQSDHSEAEWNMIFKNDADGNTIQGDKSSLIEAARKGYPIRVGFGGRRATDTLKSIEHIVDVGFITIVNGKELYGQIDDIYGQRPNLVSDSIRIDLKHENKWTIILGTNGEISTLSKYFDPEKSEESKQNNRGSNWYVKLPASASSYKAVPIW